MVTTRDPKTGKLTGRLRTWTDAQLINAVASSVYWSEIAQQLNIKPCGTAYDRFRKISMQLGIDTAHLSHRPRSIPQWCIYCDNPIPTMKRKNKYCSAECFQARSASIRVENWLRTGVITDTHAKSIRRYLLSEQNHMCAICKHDQIWQDKPLTFILDHIDGDSDNNSRSNLRLVCPNCDTQLDTYKSRNRGNGRHVRRQRYAEGKSY